MILPYFLKIFNFHKNDKIVKFFINSMSFKESLSIYYIVLGLLVNAIIVWFYFYSHTELYNQNERINTMNNCPKIILKLILKDNGLMYFILKNVGNKTAENIKIEFDKEIPYFNNGLKDEYKKINDLPIFENLSFLESEQNIELFFSSALDFYEDKSLDSINKKGVRVTISYKDENNIKRIEKTAINFKEFDGIVYVPETSLHSIYKELKELKEIFKKFLEKK